MYKNKSARIWYAGTFIGITIKTKETKIYIDVDIYAHHNIFEREHEQMAVSLAKRLKNSFGIHLIDLTMSVIGDVASDSL